MPSPCRSEFAWFTKPDATITCDFGERGVLAEHVAGAGSYTTGPLTRHSETNIHTIARFLDVHIETKDLGGGKTRIDVAAGRG